MQASGVYQELSYAIQNIGTATLRLVDLGGGYVELVNNTDLVFTVAVQPSTDELGPNDVVIFTVRFTGNDSGTTHTAKIQLRSDDPDDPTLEFNLTGESLMAAL